MSDGGSYVDPDYWGQRRNHSDDELIARLASRQGGVVGRKQLLARRIAAKAIDYRVGVGRLRVLHRGVYAVGHEAIQLRGRLVAALLVGGPRAALSHRTAAALHRIIRSMPLFVEVTTTTKAPRSRRGLVFHESGTLDVIRRHGLPLTTPARTLLDLAATLPHAELERACSEALVLGLVTADELARQRGPGSAGLRRLVAEGLAPTRSELERRFLKAVATARLPCPQVYARVAGHEVDFFWPERRLIVEVDGWRFHGHRLAFERDRSRDAELQLHGYAVVRFTWRQLLDETTIARFLSSPTWRRAA